MTKTQASAARIAEAFNMKPDELFYDDYIDNEDIKQSLLQVDKVRNLSYK